MSMTKPGCSQRLESASMASCPELTQEHARYERMRIVADLLRVSDIAHRQDIQLLVATASGGIDWEQDGPGDQAAQEADDDNELEVAEEQVAVDGLVVQDVLV